jgi:hypothetical protein
MLYNPQSVTSQIRHYCRNPRCAGKLKTPVGNPRDAFCCRGCERRFYGCRCRVCEQLFSRKTKRRQVCGRDQCRYQFKTHPDRFFGSRSITTQNRKIAPDARTNPTEIRVQSGGKSGQGWRIVAGPTDLHPLNLQIDPATLPRVSTGRVLFKRGTPPLDVIGIGAYRFPGAPKVDLDPTPATQTIAKQDEGSSSC